MSGGAVLIPAQPRPDPSVRPDRAASALEERAAGGALAPFDELVAIYQPRLTRLVHRLLGWDEGAEDVVQEVFLAALSHAHRFRGDASVGTWLTTIALNKCRSRQRRLGALWKRFVARPLEADERPSRGPTAQQAMEGVETSARVREAVRALSPRDREVVVLRYFDDLSPGEIASLTGQSKNAVEVRLHRARARLSAALRDYVEEDRRP